MSSSIFHEYDIRGHYPGEVNETIFYNLGKAYYEAFKPKKIAIGRDSRLSGETLFLYLASALQNKKVKIITTNINSINENPVIGLFTLQSMLLTPLENQAWYCH